METKSLYTVYNQQLAGYLMQKGFPLIHMIENPITKKNCFIFVNTDTLHQYMDKWQSQKNLTN